MVTFLCVFNIGLVVIPCIPPYKNQYGKTQIIGGYTYPAVTAGILGIAAVYYLLCFSNLGDSDWSLLRLVGLKSQIRPLCNGQRHPYFGYEYRLFITDPEASKESNATPPGLMTGDHSGSPPASTTQEHDIDPAVRIEVRLVFLVLFLWKFTTQYFKLTIETI